MNPEVKIVVAGQYSLFDRNGTGREALKEGDIRSYPADYAKGLVAAGLATFQLSDGESESNEVTATAAAEALMKEEGVGFEYVTGTGKNGQVTVEDVRRSLEKD